MADSLQDFLQVARRAFDAAGVPYMLAGSIASAAYGLIRATQDIDFVIDPLGVAINLDGPYSPRADGTRFSAVISAHTVPVAPTAWLVLAALAALWLSSPKALALGRSGH